MSCDCVIVFAGFLCVCIVILLQSLDAAYEPKTHGFAGSLCRPKQLAALTKALLKECSTSFVSSIHKCDGKKCNDYIAVCHSHT